GKICVPNKNFSQSTPRKVHAAGAAQPALNHSSAHYHILTFSPSHFLIFSILIIFEKNSPWMP
ncbi:MAG: hypothetical protein K0B09_12370, partial [Bacteroidales bacterium]|nr:hypothetical protein [Bacteroidales bacterium]